MTTNNTNQIDDLLNSSDVESIQDIEENIENLFEKVKTDLIIQDSESEMSDAEPKTKDKNDKDYIINPISKKKIKINGPIYKKLVASGDIKAVPSDTQQPEPKIKTKRDSSQYVINPLTKKKVKINGPKYKELIEAGHTFELPENYNEIIEKIEKEKVTAGHDLEKEIFNKVTNRWCKIGSPSYKKMIEQMKNPDKITERKTIKGPSGRNVIIGGKTWLLLVKNGDIEAPLDYKSDITA
jgi:hypothetical protein